MNVAIIIIESSTMHVAAIEDAFIEDGSPEHLLDGDGDGDGMYTATTGWLIMVGSGAVVTTTGGSAGAN